MKDTYTQTNESLPLEKKPAIPIVLISVGQTLEGKAKQSKAKQSKKLTQAGRTETRRKAGLQRADTISELFIHALLLL